MARPKKPGLNYFSKDTDFYSDRKIRRLLKEFGAKGVLIYDYLLCVIYGEAGYYVQYDDTICFDIADALGDGIKEHLVKEVVNGCLRVGLFNEVLFKDCQILTSKGIQERYCSAKRNPIIEERLKLVSTEEKEVFAAKTKVSTVKTPVNHARSTQSKVKESKGKKESKKESSLRALEFLKTNSPARYQTDFQMKYERQIENLDKFVEDFNDKVDLEGLEFTDKVLFARLGAFARNWIENQNKQKQKFQTTPTAGSYESGKLERF